MKNALFLTGAAARITQEVALIDKLIERYNIEMTPEKLVLAGLSSGALNIAGINSCFRNSEPLSWDHYFKEEVLFPIKTEEIYTRTRFIQLDTKPLRKKVDHFLETSNCHYFSDFEFETYILAFSYLNLKTLWANNQDAKFENILTSDLLMASSAIPIIFPSQEITEKEPSNKLLLKGRFADGGTEGSFKGFEAALGKYLSKNGPLDNLYIVSPMREVSSKDYDALNSFIPSNDLLNLDLKQLGLLKQFLSMISMNGFDKFIKRLEKWSRNKKIANRIFVSIPELDENYPILIFDRQKEQYQSVIEWVDKNPEKLAIPIEEYVKKIV